MSVPGGVIEIGPVQLGLTLVLVLAAGILSFVQRLGLERDLAVGTVRTFAQLFLMGYALQIVFGLSTPWLVLAVFLAMVTMAAHTVRGRVGDRGVPFILPLYGSMIASYTLVAYVVTAVIVNVRPWWEPQYFIPLGGMVIGNSMSATAVAVDRLFSDLRSRRGEVEMMLALGADAAEASRDMVRGAVRAGMIPTINSMMTVGVVFLPGMMTGQILAGADPLVSIRYQIVVMCMLAASTALSSALAVLLVRRRCFGPGQQLLLSRGK